MSHRIRAALVTLVLVAGVIIGAGPATAHEGHMSDDGGVSLDDRGHQHGGVAGHLPATRNNVDLVGKGRVHNASEGRVADVGVFGNFAYLASFSAASCEGGVYVMDISDLSNPHEDAFIPASPGSFVGEGIQIEHHETAAFHGDVLLYNNEICVDGPQAVGGATLVDVSDPLHPVVLSNGFGDVDAGETVAHEVHSAFMWSVGAPGPENTVYAVLVDDDEAADVDIFDITDPRSPQKIAEHEVAAMFPQVLQRGVGLDTVFFHDVVVRRFGNREVMLLSYWDAGYVKLDVTDPVHPTYLADSDFTVPDPELRQQTGRLMTPEGNGHQAEFTHDGRFIIATDEDFTPARVTVQGDDGTAGNATQAGAARLPADGSLTGTAIHVGVACDPATVPAPPASGGPYLAVVERGVCTFTAKAAVVEAVTANGGYAGTVVFNRTGADGCGGLVTPTVVATKPFFFVNRPTGLGLFDADAGYDEAACLALPADGNVGRGPVPIGAVGDAVTVTAPFDGWGYVHLFSNNNGKLRELDTYAVPEAMDPAHAAGFGALSVHEVATSHRNPRLAYLSYYDAGFRVVEIRNNKLVEVGRFIDAGGNDFWGVQVFERNGIEYVAASDRDSGIYIFRFTGRR